MLARLITFLHVIEEAYPQGTAAIRAFMGEDKWRAGSTDYHMETSDRIKAYIESFCRNVINEMVSCPLVVSDIVVSRGVPADAILHEAGSNDYDMITMGAWGPGVFRDAKVGRTARNLLRRIRYPVLVVPPPHHNGAVRAIPTT